MGVQKGHRFDTVVISADNFTHCRLGWECHILAFSSSYNSDFTSGLADPCKITNYTSELPATNMTLCVVQSQTCVMHGVQLNEVQELSKFEILIISCIMSIMTIAVSKRTALMYLADDIIVIIS